MRIYNRKIRREMRLVAEPGFPPLGSTHYLNFLQELHLRLAPEVYFEIGTESGASLRFATCRSVAVDPNFRLEADVVGKKPQLHFFQGTSDDFFASGVLGQLGLTVDLAFLDGLHLFEFLLRDFMNIEKHMRRDGVVALHDCVPINLVAAEREWDHGKTNLWTGDVWKVIPILRAYRPDLTIEVLNARPSGLVCITNLDPGNRTLEDRYDEILARFMPLGLADYPLARFVSELDLKEPHTASFLPAGAANPPGDVSGSVVPLVDWAAIRRYYNWQQPAEQQDDAYRIALKTFVGRRRASESTGDFHVARGLADAFLATGHSVRIDSMKDWAATPEEANLDLLIYGEGDYAPPSGNPFAVWILYPGREAFTLPESFAHAEHVFVASKKGAAAAAKKYGAAKVSVLLQGFDDAVMSPEPAEPRSGIVFVGNNHFGSFAERRIVRYALDSSTTIRLWGAGWRRHPAARYLQGQVFPNAELGRLYRSAAAVLCDHMPVMSDNGFVSNRIFDALACGAPVICDDVNALPAEFEPYVFRCKSAGDFSAAVAAVEGESQAAREKRVEFALALRARHSLRARAERILDVIGRGSATPKPEKGL